MREERICKCGHGKDSHRMGYQTENARTIENFRNLVAMKEKEISSLKKGYGANVLKDLETLRDELSSSQKRERRLREALEKVRHHAKKFMVQDGGFPGQLFWTIFDVSDKALSLSSVKKCPKLSKLWM